MGGSGSGRRWHYGSKDTTESYRSIDVRWLKREGMLSPGAYSPHGRRWNRPPSYGEEGAGRKGSNKNRHDLKKLFAALQKKADKTVWP